MLLVQLKSAGVSCGNATLRTSPSSGQDAICSLRRHRRLLACHSGAAFDGAELRLQSAQSLGGVTNGREYH